MRPHWILALLAAGCTRACSDRGAPEIVANERQGPTTIVVAAYPDLDESVRLAISRWEAKHPDVKVELRSTEFREHHESMYEAVTAGREVPDVLAIEAGSLVPFAASGALEDLDASPYDAKPLLKQLFQPVRLEPPDTSGSVVAMPAAVGPVTLFYRKDLLDRSRVSEDDLTRTWDSYIEAGKKVKAVTGARLLPHVRAIVYLSVLGERKDGESIFFDERGQPILAVRFERAFALAKRARDAGIDARVEERTEEWEKALADGKIATQPIGQWLTNVLGQSIATDTAGLWRVAQLPEGAFVSLGGAFYAIPRKASHKKEAWEFVRLLCCDREQQVAAFEKLEAWPSLLSAQEDRVLSQPIPFLGGQKAGIRWRVAAESAPTLRLHTLDGVATEMVDEALDRVLEGGVDVETALREAQRKLEERIRR